MRIAYSLQRGDVVIDGQGQEQARALTQAASSERPAGALFQFVRFWSRRWAESGAVGVGEQGQGRGRDVMVTEAVLARGEHGATINEIALELGIDQSGASRMVAQAITHGYLRKTTAADARQRLVQVTAAGLDLLTQAHQWQDATFAALTDDWTPSEVQTFTRLMLRLVAAQQAASAGPESPQAPGQVAPTGR